MKEGSSGVIWVRFGLMVEGASDGAFRMVSDGV